MIVRMKKAAILIQAKDAYASLEELRALGLLHIEHQKAPAGRNISVIKEEIAVIDEAAGILSGISVLEKPLNTAGRELEDCKSAASHIIDLRKRINQLEDFSNNLVNTISQWEKWGDFEPESLRELANKNVFIRLCQIPLNELKTPPPQVIVKKVSVNSGIANCAVISLNAKKPPFKEVPPPKMSLKDMRVRLEHDHEAIASLNTQLFEQLIYKKHLEDRKMSLENELVFQEALAGMGQSAALAYFIGYAPDDALSPLLEAAKKHSWAIEVKEPSQEDNIPTLIRNPRWVNLISPVFKMLEVVPGYAELDISLWFLVFLSVFFGILIGDSGYGAVYFALTLLFHNKFRKRLKDKTVFILLYLLSSCAIIWGVLTATYFGQEWLPASVKPLIPALRNDRSMQAFCFFLGALHLNIAHCWRAIVKLPAFAALADLGWMLILWGSYFLARLLILEYSFPAFANWLFIAGTVLVIFFSSPNKNPLKAACAGLGAFFLSVVNTFTDVVSYIRLFAVGLAAVAVADAFNKMALDLGWGSLTAGFLASLALFAGHALNILLGPLSILVHGVRLNVLEFCSHVDVKWSGFSYNPLRNQGNPKQGAQY